MKPGSYKGPVNNIEFRVAQSHHKRFTFTLQTQYRAITIYYKQSNTTSKEYLKELDRTFKSPKLYYVLPKEIPWGQFLARFLRGGVHLPKVIFNVYLTHSL